jgi:hypothetical protein
MKNSAIVTVFALPNRRNAPDSWPAPFCRQPVLYSTERLPRSVNSSRAALDFLLVQRQIILLSTLMNINRLAYDETRAGKRLRDFETIPAFRDPFSSDGNRKRDDGIACFPRKVRSSGFGDMTRPPGSINRQADGSAVF